MATEATYRNFSNPDLFEYFKITILKHAKQLIVPAVICCTWTFDANAQYPTVQSYIEHYAPLVKKLSSKTGIPASIIMGIAIIESGYGNSKNCILLKNHFGIVGKNNFADKHPKYYSIYKSYRSDEASFNHFCQVIQRKKYYSALKGKTDYKAWLQKINAGNYSCAKMVWVNRITLAIQTHHLYKMDTVTALFAWR
ncbi:MAG: glucosaminidase domain-containing protein [Bacteroidota bacterium]|nr:glucosaminidase domain-containing protein [Bacteroidota bacterium]